MEISTITQAILPESLLYKYCSVFPLSESLLFFVCSVAVLDNSGRLPTLAESFLSIVAPELGLDQHCCLGHLLKVDVLKKNETDVLKKNYTCSEEECRCTEEGSRCNEADVLKKKVDVLKKKVDVLKKHEVDVLKKNENVHFAGNCNVKCVISRSSQYITSNDQRKSSLVQTKM